MRSLTRLVVRPIRSLYSSAALPVENRVRSVVDREISSTTIQLDRQNENCVPKEQQKSVKVAIIGYPNVGKSTLLNSLMQQYISPVSRLRNITMENVLGVATQDDIQVVFLDTPGLMPAEFRYGQVKKALQENYFKTIGTIQDSLVEADVALVMFDCSLPLYKLFITADLEAALDRIPGIPKLLVLNKIDKQVESAKIECIVEQLTTPLPPIPVPSIPTRTDIEPKKLWKFAYEDNYRDGRDFNDVVTVSAIQGRNVNYIWYKVRKYAVLRPWQYDHTTVSPDDIESVVCNIVRAEIATKLGYDATNHLDHRVVGYKEEEDGLIIEHCIFRKRVLFKTEENRQDSVRNIQTLLEERFGCPVEFRLIHRWHDKKSEFLEFIDFSEEPEIEIFEE